MGGITKTRARAADRATEALRLRAAGLSYAQIGERLGITKQAAWAAVRRGFRTLQETAEREAEHLRRLELLRLDALHRAIWPHAMDGDYRAVDRILKIMDARCRLLGLYDRPETPTEPLRVVFTWGENGGHENGKGG